MYSNGPKSEREFKKFTEITLTSLQTNKLSSITPGFNGFNYKFSGLIDFGIRQVLKDQTVSPQQQSSGNVVLICTAVYTKI
jgi:hypothetical protein